MATPQEQEISLSGRIVIEGQLPVSGSATAPAAAPPLPPWWKFWKWRHEAVLAFATVLLAIATIILALNSSRQLTESRVEFETTQRPWVYADGGGRHGAALIRLKWPATST